MFIKARSTEPLVLKPSLPVSLLQVLTRTRSRFSNGRLHSLLQQDRTDRRGHHPSRSRESRRWHILCDRLKPPAATWADNVRITGLYAEPFVLIALDSSLIALGRVSPHASAFLHNYAWTFFAIFYYLALHSISQISWSLTAKQLLFSPTPSRNP